MLRRCGGDSKIILKLPSYSECSVCEEWKRYSEFKKWYDSHSCGNDNLDLDKDILIEGNKVYSPDTCLLVPRKINELLSKRKRKNNGEYSNGVYLSRKKTYVAQLTKKGKSYHLGCFKTHEEALACYQKAKRQYILECALDCYLHNEIDKKTFEALTFRASQL